MAVVWTITGRLFMRKLHLYKGKFLEQSYG